MTIADKAAMRKSKGQIRFDMVGVLGDCVVIIEPRTGNRWRVTILDDHQLGPDIAHVQDIHSSTASEIELLRVALNAYRGLRPEQETRGG